MRQVVKVQHVANSDSIWKWGRACSRKFEASISLCIWNIWKQSGGPEFQKEFLNLAANSDLMLCQEALISTSEIQFFAIPDFEVVHAATYRRLDGKRDGVMTLSKTQMLGQATRIISATAEPLLKTTKAALISKYSIGHNPDESLAVINLHSTLIRSPKTARMEVLRIAELLEDHCGPIIVGGDFNTFTSAYFSEVKSALELLGLKHARVHLDPRKRLAQLDQLFLRGLTVESIQIDTSIRHSDHFPILCKLKLD